MFTFLQQVLVYLVILPKFIIWPLFIIYRFYLKKRGIENDFVTRQIKNAQCLYLQKFRGRRYLNLLKEAMGKDFTSISREFLLLIPGEEFQAASRLEEDFRRAYPGYWDYIGRKGREIFGEFCDLAASPGIFLNQLLFELEREKKVTKTMEKSEVKWKLHLAQGPREIESA